MNSHKDTLPGTINIPQHVANDSWLNWISRLTDYVPNAMNWIIMETWEVRHHHPFSLPELIEDLESYTITFQRYLNDKTTLFLDQIDNQIIRDLSSYYNWKTSNKFSISNKSISKLIKINDELISKVWDKIIQKLDIKWDWTWDAWELIADEFEKRNFW